MRLWYYNSTNPKTQVFETDARRVSIGRSSQNDIVLESSYVASTAVQLDMRGKNWMLSCIGGADCVLDRRTIGVGKQRRLRADSEFSVYPYVFSFRPVGLPQESAKRSNQRAVEVGQIVNQVHLAFLEQTGDAIEKLAGEIDEPFILKVEEDILRLCQNQGVLENVNATRYLAGQFVRSSLLAKIFAGKDEHFLVHGQGTVWARRVSAIPSLDKQMADIERQIQRHLQLDRETDLSRRANLVERKYWNVWAKLAPKLLDQLVQYLAVQEVQKQLKDIVFGYGPLEDLLRTPTIDEIMVTGRDQIFIEKSGVIENSGRQFINDEILYSVIERIVGRVDRQIDKSTPLVDARLSDGSRVNAVIPPISLSGPMITIRKFPERRLTISQLVNEKRALTSSAVEFLEAIVGNRCNILVAGGTGTGKTTLLNCLSQFISDKERIVTIEDTAELKLAKSHVCRMESKAANCEGEGSYKIRDLLINSLRMRPDRIIVGECRGPEALDMLQAMNTGHDGSMTTLHANSPKDVILRLEVLVLSAADLPVSSIRQQISSAIDFVVQLKRMPDGRRMVSSITEICDIDPKTGDVMLKEIFRLEKHDAEVELVPTGSMPSMMSKLLDSGSLRLDRLFPSDEPQPESRLR